MDKNFKTSPTTSFGDEHGLLIQLPTGVKKNKMKKKTKQNKNKQKTGKPNKHKQIGKKPKNKKLRTTGTPHLNLKKKITLYTKCISYEYDVVYRMIFFSNLECTEPQFSDFVTSIASL